MSYLNKKDLLDLKTFIKYNKISPCALQNVSKNLNDYCTPDFLVDEFYYYVKDKAKITNTKKDRKIFKKQVIEQLIIEYKCDKKPKKEQELCMTKKVLKKIYPDNVNGILNINIFKPYKKILNKGISESDTTVICFQLINKYKNFYSLFTNYIDLYSVNHNSKEDDLKKINFSKEILIKNDEIYKKKFIYNNKLKYFAINIHTNPKYVDSAITVYNHNISLFCNFNSKGTDKDPWTIEYFDSLGQNLEIYDYKNQFIKYWNKQICDISKNLNKVCKFIQVTNLQHQPDKSKLCCIYSLYYIICRLEGIPYKYFNNPKKLITNKEMGIFSKILFRDIK